jgi:DNA (cytosine-5)-methyltransferase 1
LNEVKQIGNYETDSAWDNPQTGRVYSADGISPTLNTCSGGDRQPKIVEPQIKQVGNLTENAKRDNPQRRRVYGTTGISPALCEQMGTGGNLQPFIVASRGRNPQNPSDRTPGNYVEQRLGPNSEGLCNTLTSVQKDNLVLENLLDVYNNKMRNDKCRGTLTTNGNTSFRKCGTFGVIEKTPYRIRKLTPLECWLLMGFPESDFRKAEKVNSNTQLYKQAGNSIVKAVLMAIFRQMIPRR